MDLFRSAPVAQPLAARLRATSLDEYAGQEHVLGPGKPLREALVNLESMPAPAGEMDVVLGAGWPGVMLHEAVGHGLEGDFNRKQTSAFAGLMGQQVFAGEATRLAYMTDEAAEGRDAFLEKRSPNWAAFPYYF